MVSALYRFFLYKEVYGDLIWSSSVLPLSIRLQIVFYFIFCNYILLFLIMKTLRYAKTIIYNMPESPWGKDGGSYYYMTLLNIIFYVRYMEEEVWEDFYFSQFLLELYEVSTNHILVSSIVYFFIGLFIRWMKKRYYD